MDLAYLSIEKVEVFVLVLARTAGIFSLVPIFGASQVPAQVRVAMALGLALVLVPLNTAAGAGPIAADVLSMTVLIAKEAIVGLVIGFVAVLVFAAIQAAGDFVDFQAGFTFASMLDPMHGSQTAIAGRFHHLLAGMIFLVTNAHYIMLCGLADSFRLVPLGQLAFSPAAAGGVVDLFAALFAVSLRIAAPVLGAVFLADVAMVIVARAVPQMNILIVGFPLKLGVGLVGMVIALPVAVALMRGTLADIYPYTAGLLRLLTAT